MPVYARFKALAAIDHTRADYRAFGEFSWREGHHALKFDHNGSDAPVVIGHVERYEKVQGYNMAIGVIYDTVIAREVAMMAASGSLSGVSAEPGGVSRVEIHEDAGPDDVQLTFHEYEIGALAVVDIPGFKDCGIFELELAETGAEAPQLSMVASADVGGDLVEAEDTDVDDDFGFAGLIASGSAIKSYPSEAFLMPESPVPMPLTVFEDLSFCGHLAIYGTCHTAYKDRCVRPPKSSLGYTPAHQGTALLDTGAQLRVARISIGSNHAALGLSPRATADFYEKSSFGVGMARFQDASLGIWASGHIAHAASDNQIQQFADAAWSGDWRKIRRSLELVGVLSVNIPGFPMPDPEMWVAENEQTALVASGVREVAELDRALPNDWAQQVLGRKPIVEAQREGNLKHADRVAQSLGMPTTREIRDDHIREAAERAGVLL